MLLEITNPITSWIFPRRCVVCTVDIFEGHLCHGCASLCTAVPISARAHARAAIFFYEMVIKELIIHAKFRGGLIHAHVLLDLAKHALSERQHLKDIEAFAPSVITFIPTHWFNRMRRGIDLPQLFAQTIAKKLSLPCDPCLVRNDLRRQTAQSSKLARQKSIDGAFRLTRMPKSYERILVVDDIVTTGATLHEASRMLKHMSNAVMCMAIARTP